MENFYYVRHSVVRHSISIVVIIEFSSNTSTKLQQQKKVIQSLAIFNIQQKLREPHLNDCRLIVLIKQFNNRKFNTLPM